MKRHLYTCDVFAALKDVRNIKHLSPYIRDERLWAIIPWHHYDELSINVDCMELNVFEFLKFLSYDQGLFYVDILRFRSATIDGRCIDLPNFVQMKITYVTHMTNLPKDSPPKCFERREFLRYVDNRCHLYSKRWRLPKDVVRIIFYMVDQLNELSKLHDDEFFCQLEEELFCNSESKRLLSHAKKLTHSINKFLLPLILRMYHVRATNL